MRYIQLYATQITCLPTFQSMLFLFSLEKTDFMESYNPLAEKNPEHASHPFPHRARIRKTSTLLHKVGLCTRRSFLGMGLIKGKQAVQNVVKNVFYVSESVCFFVGQFYFVLSESLVLLQLSVISCVVEIFLRVRIILRYF